MLKTADNCEIKKYNYYYIVDLHTGTIKKVKCIDISLARPLFAGNDPKSVFYFYKEDYCQFSDYLRMHYNQKQLKKDVYRDFNCAKNSLLKKINGLKGFYAKKYRQTFFLNKKDLTIEKDET
jgi:hypothetical protein